MAKGQEVERTVRVAVLGGGRVGAAMALDLVAEQGGRATSYDVVVVDRDQSALSRFEGSAITGRVADLKAEGALETALADVDLVVGAVPGPMGFDTVRRVIDAGKPIVDISFFEQDAFALDELAKARGVAVVVDAGVAPGMSNLLFGQAESEFDTVESFACYVGGLPEERRWPWEYRAPFSPIDVLAEYTRPARMREHGAEVVRPALSGSERVEVPGLGTLEAFETDGLRTLLRTTDCPWLVEKTLRYPGHRERVEVLRETGYFSEEPITLRDGTKVRPLDVSAALLFPQWQPAADERELTVMKIVVEGTLGEQTIRRTWDLLDRTDADGTSSMARTTGYACTAMLRAVAEGLWTRPGVAAPEHLGRDAACFERVMAHMAHRDVRYEKTDEIVG